VIFNIVVDAIIQDIEACRPKEMESASQLFYADDRVVADDDSKKVQLLINNCTDGFA
jgi:hypothetical protein